MMGLYFWQLTDKRQKKELMSFYLYIIINLEFEASNASKQYIIILHRPWKVPETKAKRSFKCSSVLEIKRNFLTNHDILG